MKRLILILSFSFLALAGDGKVAPTGAYCPAGAVCHWEMARDSQAYVLCHPPRHLQFTSYGVSSGLLECVK